MKYLFTCPLGDFIGSQVFNYLLRTNDSQISVASPHFSPEHWSHVTNSLWDKCNSVPHRLLKLNMSKRELITFLPEVHLSSKFPSLGQEHQCLSSHLGCQPQSHLQHFPVCRIQDKTFIFLNKTSKGPRKTYLKGNPFYNCHQKNIKYLGFLLKLF